MLSPASRSPTAPQPEIRIEVPVSKAYLAAAASRTDPCFRMTEGRFRTMKSLILTLRYILRHPLNEGHKSAALKRYLKWQIGSRLLPGAAIMPFVNDTVLVISPGMTGATQNIYTGLHEFEDCGFLLHLLRSNDLFVDIGANVGVYTVLAAGAVGTTAVAIEPLPDTFAKLLTNLRANRLDGKAKPHNIGLGRSESTLRFTTDKDTMNHVITDENWSGPSLEVQVRTLDAVLEGQTPALIKIDVEGWESEVLAGAEATLRHPSLLALIVEMNGQDAALNSNEQAVHDCLLRNGFAPHAYNPFTRSLTPLSSKHVGASNTIYARNAAELRGRLDQAPSFQVNGRSI
jgi:FkbM family methyltransferase